MRYSRSSARALATAAVALLGLCLVRPPHAAAGGATPYAPLNLSPWIERRIDQVMILANKPILRRPISIERVMQVLPLVCHKDHQLCAQVRAYTDRYFEHSGISYASGEVAIGNKAASPLPDARGQSFNTPLAGAAQVYIRPTDAVLLSAGMLGYGGGDHGRLTAEGTLLSFGNKYAQVDFGERPHWLSPFSDSSSLISTEAPTMPSLTLSSQEPLGTLGWDYEFFLARMGYSSNIVLDSSTATGTVLTAGYPKLAGAHVALNPLPGWAIAGNAEWQFGGGARPESIRNFLSNLLKRTTIDSTTGQLTRFSNRTVSLSSAYTLPTRIPLEAYLDLAFRDTLHEVWIKPHISDTSYGLRLPTAFKHYDITAEWSEWQQGWDQDYVWLDGLTNDGNAIGPWGADWRSLTNPRAAASGATSAMLRVTRGFESGRDLGITLRTIKNADYGSTSTNAPGITRGYLAALEYSEPTTHWRRTWELDLGRDVTGKNFARLAAQLHWGEGSAGHHTDEEADDDGGSADATDAAAVEATAAQNEESDSRIARFVDVGLQTGKITLNYQGFYPAGAVTPATVVQSTSGPVVGIGVRRRVTEHADVGVRLDLSDMKGFTAGLRFLDWRYRFSPRWAMGSFIGVARYSAPTPAQGYYLGAGVQRRNILPGWDLGLEYRYYYELQRDKLLAADLALAAAQHNTDPGEDYIAGMVALTMSRRF